MMPFGQYIPTLLDGTSAADGNPLTNLPQKHHNGAESLVLHTDAEMLGLAGDGSDTFWSDDGVLYKDISYADYRAHPNGAYNLWLKCVEIDGVPHYTEAVQYPFDKTWTPSEVEKNENYFGDNCGTGQSALRDVNGDLITDVDGTVIFTA